MNFILPFTLLLLLASAPMKDHDKNFKSAMLSISWKDIAPIKVGWASEGTWHPVKSKTTTFKVPRPKYKSSSYKLYVLYSEMKAPVTIPTEGGVKSVSLPTPTPIKKHWLWGTTPTSRCNLSINGGTSFSSISLRNYKGTDGSITSIGGNFLFSVDPVNSLHFHSSIDPVSKIGKPFSPELDSKISRKCQIYHGGLCHALFKVSQEQELKVSQLEIKLEKKHEIPCPI